MKPLIGTNLKRFLKGYRRSRPLERQLAFLLQSVGYPANVGAAFRVGDGVGVAEMVLSGITPRPPHPTVEKVGRHKDRRIDWRYVEDSAEAIHQLKRDNYHIVAIELTEDAVPYFEYDFPSKVCLVVGHEDHGVTKATLEECDGAVFLPMYGKGLSLNVNVALSIVAYHVLHTAASNDASIHES